MICLKIQKGFKYNLLTIITLKIWNNANNTYDVEKTYFNSEAIMFYSESLSEPDSDFVVNLLATFSESEYDDSESDFNSVLMNLEICIFSPYIYTLLNKLPDNFFYQFSKQNQ